VDHEGDGFPEGPARVVLLDGGAPYYRTYECSDGRYMAVGAVEPQFFAKLISGLGLAQDAVPNQFDLGRYDEMKAIFTERFATRTRDEWAVVFAGTDACATPVLTWTEAAANEHLAARSTVITVDGVQQAAPAPRFSRTAPGPVGTPPKGTTAVDRIGW
jgi:alpha-methylacyl-CoA racemase